MVQVHVFRMGERRTVKAGSEKQELAAKPASPPQIEAVFRNLRKPALNRIANMRKTQAGVDARRSREHRKPVGHRGCQASVRIQEKCVIKRALVQVIKVNPDSRAGASGAATAN